MKKTIIFTFLLLFVFSFLAYGHPGNTDSNGGHYDLSTGEYHYHHGYPAHQHPNGVCPYDSSGQTSAAVVKTIETTAAESTKISSTVSDSSFYVKVYAAMGIVILVLLEVIIFLESRYDKKVQSLNSQIENEKRRSQLQDDACRNIVRDCESENKENYEKGFADGYNEALKNMYYDGFNRH